MPKIEKKYADVLYSIEWEIIATYRKNPDMSDHDVLRMLEAAVDRYAAEKIERPPRQFELSDLERRLLDRVCQACELHLGRAHVENPRSKLTGQPIVYRNVDEILLCLKRIVKSVKQWNRERGRQGYLGFVAKYVR